MTAGPASRRAACLAIVALVPHLSCATVAPRSHDYMLGVTCVVVDDAGRPIEGAQVLLQLEGLVYRAITPVREETRTTPSDGGVVFMYIAHQASTPYIMTVSKAGYEAATVSGLA